MKTRNQLFQAIFSLRIRQMVAKSMQPGDIMNILEDSINKELAITFNEVLKQETAKMIEREPYQRLPDSVQRNGYKNCRVPGLFGPMILKRPVLRKGSLVQPLLGLLKKMGKGAVASLASAFWLKGASTRNTAEIIREVFGSKLTATEVSRLTSELEPILREWENRPLPEDLEYIILDALYLPVRWAKVLGVRDGYTARQALLIALGIDSKGVTHVLGYLLGVSENTESWETLLDSLIKRGLKPSTLRLAISDEHKAIIAAVQNKLGCPHQYCVFHKMKNIRQRIPSHDRKAYLADFKGIYWAKSREDAMRAVGNLEARWKDRYPRIVETTLANLDNYLMFMNEPKERWKALRTSNRIERFNAELRRRLRPAGTIHTELELLKIFWSVSEAQERTWRTRKAYRIKGVKDGSSDGQAA